MNFDPFLGPFTKNISTWIVDLNIKAKTIKCLEDGRISL